MQPQRRIFTLKTLYYTSTALSSSIISATFAGKIFQALQLKKKKNFSVMSILEEDYVKQKSYRTESQTYW